VVAVLANGIAGFAAVSRRCFRVRTTGIAPDFVLMQVTLCVSLLLVLVFVLAVPSDCVASLAPATRIHFIFFVNWLVKEATPTYEDVVLPAYHRDIPLPVLLQVSLYIFVLEVLVFLLALLPNSVADVASATRRRQF